MTYTLLFFMDSKYVIVFCFVSVLLSFIVEIQQ